MGVGQDPLTCNRHCSFVTFVWEAPRSCAPLSPPRCHRLLLSSLAAIPRRRLSHALCLVPGAEGNLGRLAPVVSLVRAEDCVRSSRFLLYFFVVSEDSLSVGQPLLLQCLGSLGRIRLLATVHRIAIAAKGSLRLSQGRYQRRHLVQDRN